MVDRKPSQCIGNCGGANVHAWPQVIVDRKPGHYLEKPWENARLLRVIHNGMERARLLRRLRHKIAELDPAHNNLKGSQVRLLRAFL
jgi:hypothetical protein